MCRKNAIAGTLLAIALGVTAQGAERIIPPAVPTDIRVPDGYKPFFKGHAVGTQNYFCGVTSSGFKWLPIGPQATLYGEDGEQVSTHFQSKNWYRGDALQATWQHSRDTSAIWATRAFGSTDAAYVSPDAIEWLRLDVTGAVLGPTGGDKFAATKYVQRVNTVGGLPPADACTESLLNTRRFVDYEADYYFFKP